MSLNLFGPAFIRFLPACAGTAFVTCRCTCGLDGYDARFTRERSRVRVAARVHVCFVCSDARTQFILFRGARFFILSVHYYFFICVEGALAGYKNCEIA